jgi:hypothetical protein
VGIGTTATPETALDVNGVITKNGTLSKTVSYNVATATNVTIILPNGGTALVNGFVYKFNLATQATGTLTGASYIVYQTGVGTWASKLVSSNGNTSNHPLLQISGTNVQIYHNHAATYPIGVLAEATQTGNVTTISPNYFGLEGAITNNAGNLGIGTTTPTVPLHIVAPGTIGLDTVMKLGIADSSDYLLLQNNTSTATNFDPTFFGVTPRAGGYPLTFVAAVTTGNDTGSAPLVNFQARVGNESSGAVVTTRDLFNFSNFGTSVMRILANGNVGIGTSSPVAKLHVANGNQYIQDTTSSVVRGIFFTPSDNSLRNYVQGYQTSTTSTDYLQLGSFYGSIQLATGSPGSPTARLTVLNGGNVGIGTTNPTSTLDVLGSFAVRDAVAPRITMSFDGAISRISTVASGGWSLESNHTSAPPMVFKLGDGTTLSERMRILQNGNVGIGTTSPSYALDVAGTARATAYLYSSDARLKNNIQTLPNALEKLNLLRGVEFNWKKSKERTMGFIAQEVEKIFPYLVKTDPKTNLKSVEYANILAVVVEAVKSLNEQFRIQNNLMSQKMNSLERENDLLKKQNKQLELRLERLEKKAGIL